ncbi:hypothetical protein HUU05_16560 [candidate division KSB1 bacterium]|nr:hypothetical protein [candidate division KSB1 bacterium]
MKRISGYAAFLLLLTGMLSYQIATAQSVSNAKQRQDDKKGLAAANAGVADDRRDLDRLSDLVMRWDHLMKAGRDGAALQHVEEQIAEELRRDLRETAIQVQKAEHEVKQSTAEVRGSRREVRREAHDGDQNQRALRDDRRDLRDDRRDRRDEVRDANKAEDILARKREIAKEMIALQKRIDADKSADPVLQAKKRSLLSDYLALSREEIQLGLREAAEDTRELKEDRRETREDRKQ